MPSTAFILDTLLALLPMLHVEKSHGEGWFIYVIYWFVLGFLRGVDRWAVRQKNYSIWSRVALKVVVLGIVEGLILISAIEICDGPAGGCRRVFH